MTTITADLTADYRVDITNGRHYWLADEPLDSGGTDEGPSPYDLLLGSVASCTAITLSMYARRKGILVDSISARYTYDRVHAADSESTDERGEVLHLVSSQIYIDGDFTDAQRERLIDIAKRCPIHRTLEAGVRFVDEVVVG